MQKGFPELTSQLGLIRCVDIDEPDVTPRGPAKNKLVGTIHHNNAKGRDEFREVGRKEGGNATIACVRIYGQIALAKRGFLGTSLLPLSIRIFPIDPPKCLYA